MLYRPHRIVFGALFCLFAAMLVLPHNLMAKTTDGPAVYKITVGDVLEVQVWKEEGLSRTVKVRRDGRISLSLIGDVQAAGRTPPELTDVITKQLSQFIEGPEVTVIVNQQGASFYLIGEVGNTGEYPLTKDISLLQALAMGGGFSEWADKDNILLLRREQGKETRIHLNYNAIVQGEPSADNVILQPGDTIVVQ